jgi:hypothetical protein
MKNICLKSASFALLVGVMNAQLNADSTSLSALRPSTRIYVSNNTGYDMKSTFNVKALDGKTVANDAHYPNNGTVIAVPAAASVTRGGRAVDIGEIARNKGIENGRTYLFTQTIDLPFVGLVVFKQLVKGTFAGSTIEMAVNVPGGPVDQYFTDTNLHRFQIPVIAPNGTMPGIYFITLSFTLASAYANVRVDIDFQS